MGKIKAKNIEQMRGNMFKAKQFGEDYKCDNCGEELSKNGGDVKIGMIQDHKGNKVVCMDCIRGFEEQGVYNLEYNIKKRLELEEEYIEVIKETKGYVTEADKDKVERTPDEEIRKAIKELKEKKEAEEKEKERIANIDPSKWDELEPYLKEQYGVIEDKRYLKDEAEIEAYFKDDYRDYFDVGQGYYEDEVTKIVHIAGKFYEVELRAEIGSAKQEYGDRLYHVECLESVTYKEIAKPKKKEYIYTIEVKEKDLEKLREVLKREGIEVEEKGRKIRK